MRFYLTEVLTFWSWAKNSMLRAGKKPVTSRLSPRSATRSALVVKTGPSFGAKNGSFWSILSLRHFDDGLKMA